MDWASGAKQKLYGREFYGQELRNCGGGKKFAGEKNKVRAA
jgi:hypothetical protein